MKSTVLLIIITTFVLSCTNKVNAIPKAQTKQQENHLALANCVEKNYQFKGGFVVQASNSESIEEIAETLKSEYTKLDTKKLCGDYY